MNVRTSQTLFVLAVALCTNTYGGVATAIVTPTPGVLLNVSSRLDVGIDDDVLIGGFIIVGPQAKQVIVRALGPSLPFQAPLADPTLELHKGDGTVLTNDNWRENQAEVEATQLAPTNDLEAAIVVTLPPGQHTAIVRGKNSGTGVGLVEVFDLNPTGISTLGNISTRGPVGQGDNALIGGTMVGGLNPSRVLIRALGPTLSQLSVNGVLADPTLDLVDRNGNIIAQNDNWRDSAESDIQATGLAPSNDKEAALLATLAPDNYTAIVRGQAGGTGVGLMEVFRVPDRVVQTVGSSGGMVTYPGVASVLFPSGAFTGSQEVTIGITSDSETRTTFTDTAVLFDAGVRTPFEVRVKVGTAQPQTDITVTFFIPQSFRDIVPSDSEIRVFGQNRWDDGTETLDTFELLGGRFLPSATTATVTVPRSIFTSGRSSTGEFEAVLVLGTTPTRQFSRSLSAMLYPSNLDRNAPREDSTGNPSDARVYVGGLLEFLRGASPDGACAGSSLAPPLDGNLFVTSPYGPRPNVGVGNFHYGTDYRAALDTPVKAMHSGVIQIIKVEQTASGTPKGYGQYVVIKGAVGTTLYGHLKIGSATVSVNQTVNAGQTIALSGNSGIGTAAHLHVDYAPNGSIFANDNKIDPDPCIGTTVTGSITVGDNGPVADDAFSVSINGQVVCQTQIGLTNTCAVGNLRPGTATLGVTAVIAPDDAGTYGITLADGLTFSDGTTTRSGTIGEGETVSYTINIPNP